MSRRSTRSCLLPGGVGFAREWIGAVVVMHEGGTAGVHAQQQCSTSKQQSDAQKKYRGKALVQHFTIVLIHDEWQKEKSRRHNNQHEGRGRLKGAKVKRRRSNRPTARSGPFHIWNLEGEAKTKSLGQWVRRRGPTSCTIVHEGLKHI